MRINTNGKIARILVPVYIGFLVLVALILGPLVRKSGTHMYRIGLIHDYVIADAERACKLRGSRIHYIGISQDVAEVTSEYDGGRYKNHPCSTNLIVHCQNEQFINITTSSSGSDCSVSEIQLEETFPGNSTEYIRSLLNK